MPSVVPPAPPPDPEDDELSIDEDELDVPPDEEEDGSPVADPEDDDELAGYLDEPDDDPLDDAPSGAIEGDEELDPMDEDEGELEADAALDVGPLDEGIDVDDGDGIANDPEGSTDLGPEGDEIDLDEGEQDNDGGAEGTSDDPEDEVDEAALPALDEDEEGNESEEDLAEMLLHETAHALAWATVRWSVIEGAGAPVPATALSIEGARVAAAGERLLLVDEGAQAARRASFGAESTAVALTGALVLTAGPEARLSLSTDGGERANTLPGFEGAAQPIALAATPGRLWLCVDGALHGLGAATQPLVLLRERGVLAMTAVGAAIVILRQGAEGLCVERFRSDDEGFHETRIASAALRLIDRPGSAIQLAATAGTRSLALAGAAGIAISWDAGARFETLEIEGVSALCFAGDAPTAALIVVVTKPGQLPLEAALVQILPGGEVTRIAALPGVGEGPVAIAWDASREWLWVACEAGLLALAPPRRH